MMFSQGTYAAIFLKALLRSLIKKENSADDFDSRPNLNAKNQKRNLCNDFAYAFVANTA